MIGRHFNQCYMILTRRNFEQCNMMFSDALSQVTYITFLDKRSLSDIALYVWGRSLFSPLIFIFLAPKLYLFNKRSLSDIVRVSVNPIPVGFCQAVNFLNNFTSCSELRPDVVWSDILWVQWILSEATPLSGMELLNVRSLSSTREAFQTLLCMCELNPEGFCQWSTS